MELDINCKTEFVDNTTTAVECSTNLSHDYLIVQIGIVVTVVVLSVIGIRYLYHDVKNWWQDL